MADNAPTLLVINGEPACPYCRTVLHYDFGRGGLAHPLTLSGRRWHKPHGPLPLPKRMVG